MGGRQCRTILNIVETAYRATLEEQDDTVVWFTHILKNAGADMTLLLRANAVNYAVQGQDASGLRFGEMLQPRPPALDKDIATLIDKGVPVYVVTEDIVRRGVSTQELLEGVQPISQRLLPQLLDQFDHIWHW